MVSITDPKLEPWVPEKRIVVLIPEQLENISDFARQVYWIAIGQQRDIVYAAINSQEEDSLANTRLLSTLEALTESDCLHVKTLQINAERWSDALRQVSHPGDLVVCPDAQTLTSANGKSAQAGKALEQELGVSLHYLPGVYASEPARAPWLRSALAWLVGLVILAGFSYLESRLAGQISGALKKVVLIFLITFEFGILYLWDKAFV